MLYFIGVIVLILTYVLFSNFILGYKIDKKLNPVIINGSDTIASLIDQQYSGSNIVRSEDKRTGIEFSYTTWLKINDTINDTKYYNVFLKGNMQNDSLKPTQCPGVWIKKNVSSNNIELIINFDTFMDKDPKDPKCTNLTNECETRDDCDTNSEYEFTCEKRVAENNTQDYCEKKRECKWNIIEEVGECVKTCTNKSKETIKLYNIPFKRWFHLAIIVRNKEIDVYVNGNLYDTFKLKGVIKQNHNDLFFGFSGDSVTTETLNSTVMSDFRYFNYAIPYYRLDNLLRNSKNNLKVPVEKDVEFKPYLNRKYWTREDTDLNTYDMETIIR
jgi:hypothetical protein